ncbi:hypothetical protein [Streptomyces sp. SGAir0957]
MAEIGRTRQDGTAPGAAPLNESPLNERPKEPFKEPVTDPAAHAPREPRHEPGHEPREQAPGVGAPAGTDPLTGHGTPDTHTTHGTPAAPDTHGTPATPDTHGTHGAVGGVGTGDHHVGETTGQGRHEGHSTLVAHDLREDMTGRLKHAVAGFVDQPRAAVEEADHVLEDLTARLTETLAGHRRTLRTSWQDSGEDTERLRLALRDYRETAERLLKL